ncbi:MAG: NADH-quinone oxidoreductase subunit M [Chitinophagaceae bacterium]|nr:NADH-quinone oxidoreductase subunit M [Chitinophagaceae bacterium]MCA6456053.1 NADH-quinone oxidoreductase subunit M [Chitinophagaceae bacterium]MCA6459789.1 NADH-quinone oxidoreductase subunit M [Chitinophagaceae bacterium]MCA6465898.1 NADH-quinone oxidoreductase subunit M [Chitinophagaceae bacterium]MEA3425920.1 NADH-quinone oxidoreductase subunit M [Bacteroidota bacterium]
MIPVSLILIPLITGLAAFFLKGENAAKNWALLSSAITLAVAVAGIFFLPAHDLSYDAAWLPQLGSRFSLMTDGMGKMLVLLTTIAFPVIIIATARNQYKNPGSFYALLLLSQTGLLGVFLAADALVFYFFWELALVPVYFLCSIWGGEKRIAATFKFFVYTFLGSLLMLAGILYLYFQSADHSFALQSFYHIKLSAGQEALIFWLFFIAFAIKMPVFPFHTWQPDAYEQSPTAVTMILSGVMVKMGIFALLRWLLPVFPHASAQYAHLIIILSVIGMLYASLIAIRQDDIKRLIAYSSIAHIGLMSAAVFAHQQTGLEGVMIQMFNHGINVIGLWIVADVIEQQLGTRKFSDLGGLAQKAPAMAILLVVMAFANIALPLTNAFVGEFLMFNGLFRYNIWIAAVACISIILAAVYTLNMVQKVLYGSTTGVTANAREIGGNVQWMLAILVIIIIALGVYPQPMIDLTKDTVQAILANR